MADHDVHAAIDIGTNSIHLVIARVDPEGGFEVITTEKQQVRLGSGKMRRLTDDAIDRGVDALRTMGQLADSAGADITAVATSAVREAENGAEFCTQAAIEAGVHVEIISGIEEARLIHLGAIQALPILHDRMLLIDIGGGSTEFLVGQHGEALDARSMKVGAIRLTEKYFRDGKVSKAAVGEARAWVNHLLEPVARQFRPLDYTVAVGSSGTIENIAEMVERRRGNEPTTINGARFGRKQLAKVIDELLSHKTAAARAEVAGLDPSRADTIVAGGLLLEQAMDLFAIDELIVSTYALREGLLLDRFRGERPQGFHHLNDIRRHSVRRLAQLFDEDRAHVAHSTDLALRLFDDLEPLHGLDAERRDLLEAAGWVHNVGLFISHSAHHKHSYYVIRNSDQLMGFTDHEIELIAQVARYHRRSAPKMKHPEFAALDQRDRQVVRVLAGMLRLGIALDRSHDGRIEKLHATVGDPVIVSIEASDDTSLERYTFAERKGLLETALGRQVELA